MTKKFNIEPLLLITIFFTGFCFLIFEINLFRAISHLLGSTITASTIVLSVFMGGYGFGSFFLGKKSNNVTFKIRFLSFILILTGLGGALSYFAMNTFFSNIYEMMFSINAGKMLIQIVVYIMVVVCLFVPSFLIGGLLPITTRLLSQKPQDIPVKIGYVYALDTLGSALGGILTGFVLNRFLGQAQSVIIATGIMILMGCFLLVIKSKIRDETISEQIKEVYLKKIQNKSIKIAALFSTFLFGFVVNSMQILFIRAFKIYLINAVYSFTLITSLFIFGFFLGSWTFKKVSQKKCLSVRHLFHTLIISGFLILFIMLIILNLPQWLMVPLNSLYDNPLFRVLGIPVFAAIVTVLPLAFLSGFAFPLANSLYADRVAKTGEQIGKTVMFNTIGAVLGPLAAAFIFIFFFGVSLSMLFLAGMVFISSFVLLFLIRKTVMIKTCYLLGIIGILIIVSVFWSGKSLHILPPSYFTGNKKIMVVKESTEGTFVVGEEIRGNSKVITTHINNSVVIGTSYDAIKAVKMVGHLPFLLGLEGENALIVGFGIGVTAAAIGVHSTVKHIDCVELVPELTQVAHYYEEINNNIQNDTRLNFIGDDGRHFLKTSNKKYDLISSDPTHPILGSGNIYTQEYFELCRAHLSSKGMVSQYLPLHKLRLKDLLGIIKTFYSVFPHSSLWLGHYHGILMGSLEPQNIDFQKWETNMERTTADRLFYNNPYHLAASLIFDEVALSEITEPYKINTDNIAYTDYFAFESLNEDNHPMNLKFLNDNRTGVHRFFTNLKDSTSLQRFSKGNINLTDGLYYLLKGNPKEYQRYLEKACMVNPENEEYSLLINLKSIY